MFTFRSMNTDVLVSTESADEELTARGVAEIFWDAERRFSRFRPDSELSRLNRACGWVNVSRELFDVLRRAREYVELTGGIFDPGIGGALVALGYDRSFSPGQLDRQTLPSPPVAGRFLHVVLDAQRCAVERPDHVQIDLGGVVKGRTLDKAAELLQRQGAIDAGGDAVVRGPGTDGDGWLIDVEDPTEPTRSIATVHISDCAVATSATSRRRWRAAGRDLHHLIDPRTLSPATTDLSQVTVIAPRAELAEVLSKTAFVIGVTEARLFLERQPRIGAVLVPKNGSPLFVGAIDVRDVHHG